MFPSKDLPSPPIPPSCHPQLNFLPPGDRFSRKDSHTEREENKHITLTHLQSATILDCHHSTMQQLLYLFYLLSHFVTPLKTKQPLLSIGSSQKRQLLRLKSLPALPSAWLICPSLQLIWCSSSSVLSHFLTAVQHFVPKSFDLDLQYFEAPAAAAR